MKKWIYSAVLLGTICILGLLVGAINQLSAFSSRFHPLAGDAIFWVLVAAVGFGVLYGLFPYARMSPALPTPEEGSGEAERARYLDDLRARLRKNPRLKGRALDRDADLEEALIILATDADAVIRQTASMVFITTALMQNGRLDGLVVLATQLRMIWRIAAIYVQRPSPREMFHLYANVAATAFVAGRIEDLDIGQMFAPVATSALPALKAGIPGLHGVSALLVRCVSNGAANAFLTLRVGEVGRRYCALTSETSRDQIRSSATASAVSHLRRIVAENGALVAKNAWDATAGVLVESGVAKAEELAKGARSMFDRFFKWSEPASQAAQG
jgi:hypothetical protein